MDEVEAEMRQYNNDGFCGWCDRPAHESFCCDECLESYEEEMDKLKHLLYQQYGSY